MNALITKNSKPRVRMAKGKVTIFKISPRVIFRKPITRTATSAEGRLTTRNPGTI